MKHKDKHYNATNISHRLNELYNKSDTEKKNNAQTFEYFKTLTLRTLGNFLILTSLFFLIKTFYMPVAEEVRYYADKKRGITYEVADTSKFSYEQLQEVRQKGALSKLLKNKKIKLLIPPDPKFSIVIPKIAANSIIIPNVDPSNEKEYLAALKKGVAHTKGTAFPGQPGHIFLFAHSTDYFWNVGRYNAVFYLLYKLEKGDEIDIFYNNQRFVYKVIDKTIITPDQVEYLTRKTNKEFLTLQTCWPPGTTLKRILVFAVRVSDLNK